MSFDVVLVLYELSIEMAQPSDASSSLHQQTKASCLPSSACRQELKKELNILLLGESGVGKSTWINRFANYMVHSSLKAAERHGLFPVPLKFELTRESMIKRRLY